MVAPDAGVDAPSRRPIRGRIGVLAVQGAFGAHSLVLRDMGASVVAVRQPADLAGVAGLVLPGGESTTISLLTRSNGLWQELAAVIGDGLPVLATCAGAIILANDVLDGRADQRSMCLAGIAVRRNGFGRQVDSFEADVELSDGSPPLPGVFIRAPVIERTGPGVEVLGTIGRPDGGRMPVLCRQGNLVIATFHPELTSDRRVHALAFGSLTGGAPVGVGSQAVQDILDR
jgi:pyridoxal 5'-phosphate synthase pdxT subunit